MERTPRLTAGKKSKQSTNGNTRNAKKHANWISRIKLNNVRAFLFAQSYDLIGLTAAVFFIN